MANTPVSYFKAFAAWAICMAAETVNGVFRTLIITPYLGDKAARRVSFGIALLLILLIAIACTDWIRCITRRSALAVGFIWAVSTFFFEVFLIGTLLNVSWPQVIDDYDPRRGGLMAFGLLYLLAVPNLARYLRSYI